jgi:3-deoxy-D-manno-octulosonic-acid transferase
VADAAELEKVFADLLGSASRRRELGERAAKVVQENMGAVERTVDMIVRHLDTGDHYITPGK